MRPIGWGLILGCVLLTAHRATVWRSDEALWTAAVRVTPAAPRPLINLAAAYARQGRWAEAHQWLHRASDTRRLTAWDRQWATRLHDFLCVTAGFCCASSG